MKKNDPAIPESTSITAEQSQNERQWEEQFRRSLQGDQGSSQEQAPSQHNHPRRLAIWIIPSIILAVGIIAFAMILAFGYYSASNEQDIYFEDKSRQIAHQISVIFEEYELVAQWIRQVAHDGNPTRQVFRQAYEYVTEQVLQFGSVGVINLVRTNETLRGILETDTREFLREFIDVEYAEQYGGFHNESFLNGEPPIAPRDEYAVIHMVEPIVVGLPSTLDWLDLDLLQDETSAAAIAYVRETQQPALTKCIPCFGHDSVVLLHPGIRMSWELDDRNNLLDTMSLVEIRLDYLLFRMFQRTGIVQQMGTFLFDSTEDATEYLAGAYHEVLDESFVSSDTDSDASVQEVYNAIVQNLTRYGANIWTISSEIDELKRAAVASYTQPDGSLTINGARFRAYIPEDSIENIQRNHDRHKTLTMDVGSRQWTIVITGNDADYPRKIGYVILSAVMLLAGCSCLALWIYSSEKRSHSLEQVRLLAEAEKTDIVVKSARQAAKNERELNDYIAHEVRNPLSAAISAATFVSTSVSEAHPLQTEQARNEVREDMSIIESSLQFINDLLRNMLDIHRASSHQLALNLAPLDLLHDVLQPVASMVYSRTSMYKVEVECPENLCIMADKIRLKQVILNLGRNAAKFVEKGFVRFRAAQDGRGQVILFVEDSGPGIPKEKREKLFEKFQDSLDSLQQGTGIGLAVCQSIISIMGGSIELDEQYDSGLEGRNCKGTRFIIKLALEPVAALRLSYLRTSHSSGSYKSIGGSTNNISFRGTCQEGPSPSIDFGASFSELPNICADEKFEREDCKSFQKVERQESLPNKLSVLFVDDDMILRKLFVRSVKKTLPEWRVEQCANGETCMSAETPPFLIVSHPFLLQQSVLQRKDTSI